ncbi:MAG: undecaprenyldiphospho-muramoylpentapeptide beta-N-acetylglucosaminyltransferase [Patescibacteria group bacterium]|nr:undecaprenyldiphospho-muramoylpentapeptide beta-N-acetylglucosaminyltransferase [bacterium]MDZ4240939.1 undecaprenyldiphospho-muramoylpentapeptide beta-N-acetylglucosaminyltransferase [Patescibacteria group bacterium]
MKILFTGGVTGGHFYPIIAVAQEINKQVKENKLFGVELYYISTSPYNEGILYENGIIYRKNPAGKIRGYFSLLNVFDVFKTAWGVIRALFVVFDIFPDVIFGKGGYASFPALLAGRILKIPVVIHESDTAPGKVNAWAGKFARRIALSYPETISYFPKEKVAITGNPVRKEMLEPATEDAEEYFNLEKNVPVILVLGGSQGAQIVNNAIIDSLPQLVERYQVIHQTGKKNLEEVKTTADVLLLQNQNKYRHKPYDYLDTKELRMASQMADLVISRAGSTIFEIAAWGKPAVLIPITNSNDDHQRKNAFAYARAGAAFVIEEKNLSANILLSEIERILANPEEKTKMEKAAKDFFKPDAAEKIAREILSIGVEHEG